MNSSISPKLGRFFISFSVKNWLHTLNKFTNCLSCTVKVVHTFFCKVKTDKNRCLGENAKVVENKPFLSSYNFMACGVFVRQTRNPLLNFIDVLGLNSPVKTSGSKP